MHLVTDVIHILLYCTRILGRYSPFRLGNMSLFKKTGFHAVYYIATMPQFVKQKPVFFGIILYSSPIIFLFQLAFIVI